MASTERKRVSDDDDCKRDMRCMCGSLIARLVDGGVEIKCRRCQRIVRVPLQDETRADRTPP